MTKDLFDVTRSIVNYKYLTTYCSMYSKNPMIFFPFFEEANAIIKRIHDEELSFKMIYILEDAIKHYSNNILYQDGPSEQDGYLRTVLDDIAKANNLSLSDILYQSIKIVIDALNNGIIPNTTTSSKERYKLYIVDFCPFFIKKNNPMNPKFAPMKLYFDECLDYWVDLVQGYILFHENKKSIEDYHATRKF